MWCGCYTTEGRDSEFIMGFGMDEVHKINPPVPGFAWFVYLLSGLVAEEESNGARLCSNTGTKRCILDGGGDWNSCKIW